MRETTKSEQGFPAGAGDSRMTITIAPDLAASTLSADTGLRRAASGAASQPSLRPQRLLLALTDDSERRSLARYLARHGYPVIVTRTYAQTLDALLSRDVFLALIDSVLEGHAGVEILAEIRARQLSAHVILTSADDGMEAAVASLRAGAFDYLRKPYNQSDLLELIDRASEHHLIVQRDEQIVRLREREKLSARHQTEFMLSLVRIIDAKSRYTREHSDRVGRMSRRIAKELGSPAPALDRIELGGRLHDIGKIGTPEAILNKEGPLTSQEFAIIKEHPVQGAELVRPISILAPIVPMILHHHENFDGSGYPEGLEGNAIPIEAQIVKLADTYDAMTSARPYRATPLESLGAFDALYECRDVTIRSDLIDALERYCVRRAERARSNPSLVLI
ncbi:MAG: HD domain-containing phosphohydrolase [Planctomycetota bacterium]